MSFLNPTYLWALLGLLIPLVIHLWSKKEGKTIKVGSIKLLSEADSKQSSSIRLNEIMLLVLRLGIVTMLVLIIAQPITKNKPRNSAVAYLVEPSLLEDSSFSKMIDSLKEEAPVYLFSNDLKALQEDPFLKEEPLNYWSWTKQAQELPTDSLVIFTKGYTNALIGKRPAIRIPAEFIIVNNDDPKDRIVEVIQGQAKVRVAKAKTNDESTTISLEEFSESNLIFNGSKDSIVLSEGSKNTKMQVLRKEPIKVAMYVEAGFEAQQSYLEAGFNALSTVSWVPIEVIQPENFETQLEDDIDAIIWLSTLDCPERELKTLIFQPDILNTNLIEIDESNRYYLREALNSENIIEKHLVEHLALFLDVNAHAENKLEDYDQRIVDKTQLMPKIKEVSKTSVVAFGPNKGMTKWLWIALIFLLFGERILANYRKQ